MSATNHTPNLDLSQFIPLDKPAWLGDYNSDMSKIDTTVHNLQTQTDSMETAVEQATTSAQAATQAAQAATEAAQDAADKAQDAETTANNIAGSLAGKVNKTGDTMTGPLVLPGDPTEDNQAATKAYVDNHGGGAISDPLQIGEITNKTSTSVGGSLVLGPQNIAARVLGDTPLGFGASSNPSSAAPDNFLTVCVETGSPAIHGGNMQIKEIKDPTEAQDAATKAYVDAKAATKAYVDANAGGVSSYTNPTPGAHVSSCFGTAVVVGKLLIVDAVITINNILNSGDILFEFASTGISAGDGIGGIMSAAHTSDAAYTSKDISIGFFGGDITVSYSGTSFGSNGNVYRVTFYSKLS